MSIQVNCLLAIILSKYFHKSLGLTNNVSGTQLCYTNIRIWRTLENQQLVLPCEVFGWLEGEPKKPKQKPKLV